MSTLTAEQEVEFDRFYGSKNLADIESPYDAGLVIYAHQQAKIDALVAERQTLRTNYEFQRERADALQAKLDALEKQEPVGYANPLHLGIEITTLWTSKLSANDVPLYSQPVPASPEIAKVELNMGDMLASCDLMAPVPAASEGKAK